MTDPAHLTRIGDLERALSSLIAQTEATAKVIAEGYPSTSTRLLNETARFRRVVEGEGR